MNSVSVSPSDINGRLAESRKLSWRSPDCDATHTQSTQTATFSAMLCFHYGPNELPGSTDGAARFAAPLPHPQRAAATWIREGKVRKCTKKVYLQLLPSSLSLLNWVFEERKTSSTERLLADRLSSRDQWPSSRIIRLRQNPRPLTPVAKLTNLGTDTATKRRKKNANQFCVLARLGVCFALFSTSASGRGQMSQRGFVYL